MDTTVNISGKNYFFATDYKDNDVFRRSFNRLTQRTFGFDFEQWYMDGYWQNRYIPYSMLDGDIVVANVSVNVLDFLVLGQRKSYVQLGTVMTDQAYRGMGLSRALMERVLNDWQDKSDLIYLYANDSVLNFYPKFGFEKVHEYQCSKVVTMKDIHSPLRKLDMLCKDERDLLYRTASRSECVSKISMIDNVSLIMFYCTSFMKDNIYYLDKYDAVVIAEYNKDILHLQDIFCADHIPIDYVIEAMMNEQIKKVILGFTPLDDSPYEVKPIQEDDTTLFVKYNGETLLESEKLMFPILSHT